MSKIIVCIVNSSYLKDIEFTIEPKELALMKDMIAARYSNSFQIVKEVYEKYRDMDIPERIVPAQIKYNPIDYGSKRNYTWILILVVLIVIFYFIKK